MLSFPVLSFSGPCLYVDSDFEKLTTCMKGALKDGYFEGLVIVDSRGLSLRVKNARKLRCVGPFRGYNIFLNQRIQVDLELDGEPFESTVDELRKRVLHSFSTRSAWKSRDDFHELKLRIKSSQTVEAIINVLTNK